MQGILVGVIAALVLIWAVFVVVLLITKPDEARLRDIARIIPDIVRLVSRLAQDDTVPRGVRLRLWFLLAYLALPIDLVPDFVPVIGFADDAIITSLVLRSAMRSAGADKVEQHWPGTPMGLATLFRLCGVGVVGR